MFHRPAAALYVFGLEDGTIPKSFLKQCHRFIVIPTRHCLNLATAISTVLWDREHKLWLAGEKKHAPVPGEHEGRGFVEAPGDLVVSRRK